MVQAPIEFKSHQCWPSLLQKGSKVSFKAEILYNAFFPAPEPTFMQDGSSLRLIRAETEGVFDWLGRKIIYSQPSFDYQMWLGPKSFVAKERRVFNVDKV